MEAALVNGIVIHLVAEAREPIPHVLTRISMDIYVFRHLLNSPGNDQGFYELLPMPTFAFGRPSASRRICDGDDAKAILLASD
jgi:hypothetical protein